MRATGRSCAWSAPRVIFRARPCASRATIIAIPSRRVFARHWTRSSKRWRRRGAGGRTPEAPDGTVMLCDPTGASHRRHIGPVYDGAGKGTMNAPFVFLGTSHLVAIALTFAAPLALTVVLRRNPGERTDAAIRYGLAALVAANWLAWMMLLYAKHWLNIGNEIPLNLCDWATVAVFIALVWPSQKSFELAYFWGLCGTMQALITPDCRYDFPDAQFTLFFVYHGGIIAAVLYLTI